VTGATAVIRHASRTDSKLASEWLRQLLSRKPRKLVAIALANKMARIVWAIMTSGEVYRHPTAGAAAAA
jgi:transposase